MIQNDIDVSPVQFMFIDDRLLIAQLGQDLRSQNVIEDLTERLEHILENLISVVDSDKPFSETPPVLATITDEDGNQVKNLKFSCHSLMLSPNFFNQGHWLIVEWPNKLKKRYSLTFDSYKSQILTGEVVH